MLKIVETKPDVSKLTVRDQLEYFGYGDYAIYDWNVEEDGGYSHHTGRDGGRTTVVVGPDSKHSTIVFIKTGEIENDETQAGINIAILFHEIGHVNDLEQKVNFQIGQ